MSGQILFLIAVGARLVTPDFAAGLRRTFAPVRWTGAFLVLVSVALRIVSVVQLGPAYSVDLGVGLVFWHRLATPLCLLLPPAVIAWRIRQEEGLLERAFGEEYREWARRTRRLVPFVV